MAPIRKKHVVPVYVKNGTAVGSQSRCESCVHSHILQGFRESEEVTYCYYATLMVVPFKVRECSNYQDKARPTWEQMEDLAIEIRPTPTFKPAGFRCSEPTLSQKDGDKGGAPSYSSSKNSGSFNSDGDRSRRPRSG